MKIGLFLLLVNLTLEAQGPVPRPAPNLRIVEASGRATILSAFRGRVVLLAFISTQCAHCQRASVVFEQISHEFAESLQVAEVAFDQGADTAAFTKRFGLSRDRVRGQAHGLEYAEYFHYSGPDESEADEYISKNVVPF